MTTYLLTYCSKISIALIFWIVETISSGLQFVASISLILSPSKTIFTFLPPFTKATITPATPPIRAVHIGSAMLMYSRLPTEKHSGPLSFFCPSLSSSSLISSIMSHLARQWIDSMKLFIFTDKLPFVKRLKFAAVFFSSGLTILTGKNLSFSFQTTSTEKIGFFGADVYQKNLPSNETIILLSTDDKIIQNSQ